MSQGFQKVWEQVQDLEKDEQLALVEAIIQHFRASETEAPVQLSPAWEEELDQRDRALAAGEMPLAGWQEVKQRIRSRFEEKSS
jgi:putative addiction module component (TIGR02574 family)